MTTVIYLWRIRTRSFPRAIWHMASDRIALKRNPAISFFKLIGTGTGQTFTPRDADPTLWGLILSIQESELEGFDESDLVKSWRSFALTESRYIATPISVHGSWSKSQPFVVDTELAKSWEGKVLAITRARIRWRKNLQFWRAVPPVIESLRGCAGVESASGLERRQSDCKAHSPCGVVALPSGSSPTKVRLTLPRLLRHNPKSGTPKNYSLVSPCSRFAALLALPSRAELTGDHAPVSPTQVFAAICLV